MSVTALGSGTKTATLATEHILYSSVSGDAGKVMTFHVDKLNMTDGDALELRVYQMILTGGVARVAYKKRFTNAQSTDDMVAISVAIANDLSDAGALKFTLNQTKGSAGRDFYYKVLAY